jgi:hypothetical protein
MLQSADFRKLEQKAYLSYHQDGLLDLLIAAVILSLGINEAMDTSIGAFIGILLCITYVPLKRQITFPRLGYVKFNVNRGGVNLQLARVVVTGILVLLLVGTMLLLRAEDSWALPLILAIRKGPLLLYALIGFIGFGLAGLLIGLRRLLFYAVLSLVLMVGGHLLNQPLLVPLLVLGFAILAIGAVLLVSFLRRYPIAEEENHANQ